MKIGIFNAFAPLVHLGALESVAAELDLELLEIVAEPYAVARVIGAEQVRQAGALFVDIGGGTTDVALVRVRRDRGDADVRPRRPRLHEVARRPPRPAVPAGRGAQGRLRPRARRRAARRDRHDRRRRRRASGRRAWSSSSTSCPGGDLLPSRIYLCGGGSRLPETATALRAEAFWRRLPFSRPPEVAVMSPEMVEIDRRRDRAARRPAGRDAARPGQPGDRPAGRAGSARRGTAPRPAGDEAVGLAMAIVYLDIDDEITTAAARIRTATDLDVALVLPAGSRIATSRINFRLLAREAAGAEPPPRDRRPRGLHPGPRGDGGHPRLRHRPRVRGGPRRDARRRRRGRDRRCRSAASSRVQELPPWRRRRHGGRRWWAGSRRCGGGRWCWGRWRSTAGGRRGRGRDRRRDRRRRGGCGGGRGAGRRATRGPWGRRPDRRADRPAGARFRRGPGRRRWRAPGRGESSAPRPASGRRQRRDPPDGVAGRSSSRCSWPSGSSAAPVPPSATSSCRPRP